MRQTLPARLYDCPQAYERERAGVFAKSWLFMGHEGEAPEPGDWITLQIAGWPLVAVRGRDGVLRGFHNVCRHRAAPLVQGDKGSCPGELTCPYHGWRFTLDGRLRSATGFGPAEGFDPRDYGLFAVRLETWRGLVFVNLDPDAAPLADKLAPLEALMVKHDLSIHKPAFRRSHDLACDWKVYAENYLEGYHVHTVHPVLAEEIRGVEYQTTIVGDLVAQEAVGLSQGPQFGLWSFLWPNLAINIYRSGAMLERATPDGPGRMKLDYLFLNDEGEAGLGDALVASVRLTKEDMDICEAVQRNLSAGVYDRGVLSPTQENGVAWFQERLAPVHS